ncbi:RNA polymerase factor sigma-54 [Peptococcaceae bacterium 1198_IL3148]
MRLGYGLSIEQTQKLIMTPELRQAIAILQMSSLDLTQFVEQQLQENPLLEKTVEEAGLDQADAGGHEDKFDIDWQEYFQDSSDLGDSGGPINRDKEYNYEAFVAEAPSLSEHLNFQLAMSNCPKDIAVIVKYLIGNLDPRGYLHISLDEVKHELNSTDDKVAAALEVLQSMEPVGIGARTLEECLLLQVKGINKENPLLISIIQRHLKDLAQGKYNKIATKLGVTVKEVQRVADTIRMLDPKPARNFSHRDDNQFIVPDVVVEKVGDEYIILVNDVTVPRIRVNNLYKSVVKQSQDNDARKYVETKLNAALWLIRSIEQRRMTLYRVTNTLVELQQEFLDYGVKYLKPLNLKDVANRLELHESTISRATANKYIQTPQGVFEMKYFFSSGIKRQQGNDVSSESIKKLLQEVVAGEDPKKPLSDQKIADLLKEKGIQISRRTVTKYRDELGILSTSQRKRY